MSNHSEEKKDNDQYSKNFTRIPNILFRAYRDLSREEKFLYCTLRCIYWDMKPRFVTLRELAEETGYAIASLSKMLPRLDNACLIHAEVRREKARNGKEKGSPKYHITITDIWEVNRLFYSCSQDEQTTLLDSPSADFVRDMNNLVRNTNDFVRDMNNLVSIGEQSQAQIERAKDIIKDTSKDLFKDKEEKNASNDASPRALVFHPEHTFIGFDDLLVPSLMVVRLTPKFPSRYWSEMEDKRRRGIVGEVMHYLEQKGIKVTIKWEYETEQEIEHILAENEKRSHSPIVDVDNTTTTQPTQEDEHPQPSQNATELATLPPIAEKANVETTPAKIEAHAQTEAVSPKQAASNSYSPVEATHTPAKVEKPAKPELPAADVKWCAEIAVQIIEARKGRRYSDTTRTQELSEAKRVLKMEYDDGTITRDLYESALDDMLAWPFWKEHTNVRPMIKTLRRDDKIITILDDLKAKPKINRKSAMQASANVPPVPAPALTPEKEAEIKAALERLEQQKQSRKKGAIA